MSKGVFVLGAARSGTSAVARVVGLLGVSAGREDDHKPADDDNPRGYWESRELTSLNRRLLVEAGGAPYGPAPALADDWFLDPGLDALREEAAATLRRVFPTSPWVWKDPRTSFTLPFWLAVADVEPVVVLVYRDPLEVADSLVRRDDAPAAITVAVWERSNRAALANAAGLPAFVVRYDRLVEDPAPVAIELAAFFRSRGLNVAHAADAVQTFVDPALRHSRPDETLSDLLSREQMELLTTLDTLQGSHSALSATELPPETPWIGGLLEGERRTGLLDTLRRRRQAERESERQIATRDFLGLELRVHPGTPAWRALAPVRALRRKG